jgi:O-antigen/teichoic acid export membrane protein
VRFLRRNLLLVYGVYAAAIAVGLVTTPIAVHALGKTQYGLWTFVLGLTEYLNLLDLGVSGSVIRYGAKYRGERADEETNALASVALTVYALIGLLALVVGVVLVAVVPYLIDLPASLDGRARLVVALVALGFVFQFPLGLFGDLLAAQQRYDVMNVAALVSLPLYVALVAVVLPRTHDVVWLAAIVLGTTLLRLVVPLLWIRRELPFLRPRRALVSRSRLRELTRFSADNFVMHMSSKVVFTSDVVVVGIVLGPRQAALYAIPAKLFSTAFGIGSAGQRLLLPAFAEFEGAEDRLRQRLYLRSGIRLGMAAMLVLALPLVLVPGHLIRAWVGSSFVHGRTALIVLGVVLLVLQPTQVLGQYLLARGRQRRIARLLVLKVVANLALSVVLARAVGIWGVAAATLVTEIAIVLVLPWLVLLPDDPGWRDLLRSWLRPVAPALVVALPLFLGAAAAYDPGTLAKLAPLGVAWVALGGAATWRFGLSAGERDAITRKLRGRDAAETQPAAAVPSLAETTDVL